MLVCFNISLFVFNLFEPICFSDDKQHIWTQLNFWYSFEWGRLQTLAAGEAGNLFPSLPTLTLAPHLEAEASEPAAVATTTAEPAAFTTTAEQAATTTTAEQAATTTTAEQAATTTTAEQAATTTTAEQAATTTSESTTSEVADEPTLGEADVAASSVGEGGDITGATEEEIWAEEEKEEEEEEFSPVDVGCSWTLIGSLFFTMVMFYFVNYPDDDIKRYTWSIINSTLSATILLQQHFVH